jgi:adenylate cyclase
MGAKLQVQPASAPGFEVPIGNTATIGRTRENTVCLHFSPQVSRQHAVIRCHNGWQFQLIDLGSRNGTYVNDRRVIMPVTLENAARIRIADNLIVFAEDADAGAPGAEQNEATMVGSMAGSIAEARPVALLVCDVRGFSTMSEKVASGDLAQFIGAWFREAGNLVHATAGTVDKFIGDAMLAYWGAEQDGPRDCRAAFETAQRLQALAAERRWPNGEPFRIAVALHYGRVTCSNVGLAAARDATIIGDAVNTVFRLEAVSKELNQATVLSHPFAEHLPEGTVLQDFGERALKGKKQLVRVHGFAG